MRIEKDNLVSTGLNIIAIPIMGVYFLSVFILKQLSDFISLIVSKVKNKFASIIAIGIVAYIISLITSLT
ncbi:hypothetical protein KC866_03030 [Patescibacteria group bacterium]|nr:hypothetical protein [Patescibacteria group bacterium]